MRPRSHHDMPLHASHHYSQNSNGANTQSSNALTASLTCSQLAAGDAPEGEPAASLQKPVEVGKPPVGVTMVPVAAYLPAVVYPV